MPFRFGGPTGLFSSIILEARYHRIKFLFVILFHYSPDQKHKFKTKGLIANLGFLKILVIGPDL
jgi:hypothetical protein